MRKRAGFFLTFLIIISLCGCSRQALEGTWEYDGFYDGEAIMEMFVYMDLYEEEMALMDPGAIGYVETVTFREDGTYTIACDVERSTALAEEYYSNALDAFYENRADLEQCYGVSFGFMDRDSFFGFDNNHINEKGFFVIAEHAVKNLSRVLIQNEEPILEEENVRLLITEK